jgi:large subunit ribosomal protein L23
MALFSKQDKKDKEIKAKAEAQAPQPLKKAVNKKSGSKKEEVKAPAVMPQVEKKGIKAEGKAASKNSVLKGPRVTEKAAILHEKNNVYTFNVAVNANVQQIAQAIKVAYKVTPVKVSVVSIPAKTMFARGRKGKTISAKKAYVYLKKGDVIEFA